MDQTYVSVNPRTDANVNNYFSSTCSFFYGVRQLKLFSIANIKWYYQLIWPLQSSYFYRRRWRFWQQTRTNQLLLHNSLSQHQHTVSTVNCILQDSNDVPLPEDDQGQQKHSHTKMALPSNNCPTPRGNVCCCRQITPGFVLCISPHNNPVNYRWQSYVP